jgi:hypothetical protein
MWQPQISLVSQMQQRVAVKPGAPADMIAVKGDPAQSLKALEYPDLVMSGGKIVVNNFERSVNMP